MYYKLGEVQDLKKNNYTHIGGCCICPPPALQRELSNQTLLIAQFSPRHRET